MVVGEILLVQSARGRKLDVQQDQGYRGMVMTGWDEKDITVTPKRGFEIVPGGGKQ